MNHTTNYNLNQWEADDRITREDFNADNAAIDAALKTIADSAEGGTEIAFGTYVGDGTLNRKISLSFTPRVVLVMRNDGLTRANLNTYGGLALTGAPSSSYYNENGGNAVAIVSGGFEVSSGYQFGTYGNLVEANQSGKTYHYLAFR